MRALLFASLLLVGCATRISSVRPDSAEPADPPDTFEHVTCVDNLKTITCRYAPNRNDH